MDRALRAAVLLVGSLAVLTLASTHGVGEFRPSQAVALSVPSSDIYVMRPTGYGLRRVTRGRYEEHAPRWSPGAEQIAYVRARRPGFRAVRYDLWVSNAGGRKARVVARSDRRGGPVTATAWSPEGDALAFTYGRSRLDSVDLKTRTRVQVAGVPRRADQPSVSVEFHPDGNGFIYDVGSRLEVVDRKGDVRQRIPLRARFTTGFDVSPDGRRIVYVRGNKQLWTMNADGTGRSRLRAFRGKNMAVSSPTYSANGKRIAFSLFMCRGDRPTLDIYVMGKRARALKRITRRRGLWHRNPDWGSNGQIVFVRSAPFGSFDPCA
jgi:Tol biopolymer transport system component